MKKLWLLLLLSPLGFSQTNASIAFVTVTPSGACATRAQMRLLVPSGILYSCQAGTWGPFGTGSGTLGGDVTGASSANTVVKIQNQAVSGVQGTATNPKVMAAGTILPGIGFVFCQDSTGTVTTTNCKAGTTNQNLRTMGYHFDGGGSALSGTITYCAQVPITGTILGWHIDADQSGSATFAVRSVAFGSYTGTAGFAGYTDVTGGGTAPILSSAVTATYSNLTSWVTSVNATDEYCFQLSSPATITWVNVVINFTAI